MPELPDIVTYIAALKERVLKRPLVNVRVTSPFLLRSFDPPLSATFGKTVNDIRRMGKRIVFRFDEQLFAVLHLMIAGRLRWRLPKTKITPKIGLAAFDFPDGTLLLTEASSKKRASLHVVRGEDALSALDPGGLEVLDCTIEPFHAAIRKENHTIKRSLTDPHLFSGIGNAYSDEILHRAKMSPFRQTLQMTDGEIATLFTATRDVLNEWSERLDKERGLGFPEEVTAFREGMAVHGRYNQPCPVCGSPVQRIRYAENEANYCATCQTGGKLLADRSLSRLLKEDWPRTLEELEERTAALKALPPIHSVPSPLRGEGRREQRERGVRGPTRTTSAKSKGAQAK